MEVVLTGPAYGTWGAQQASFDNQFTESCTLGDLSCQEDYRRDMFDELNKRLKDRRDLLQQYDPLEVHKLKQRDAEFQKMPSTAQHQSAITVSFSKEEIQKQVMREKKKKRPAEAAPNGAPASKKKPPPIPPKKKTAKGPPPIPPKKKTKTKKTAMGPPPIPGAEQKKSPPPIPSAQKKRKAPPPIPGAKKDVDGDTVMGECGPDFSSPDVRAWSHVDPHTSADTRRDRTCGMARFVAETGSEEGDGSEVQTNALLAEDNYKALLDRVLVVNTVMFNAYRNHKQFPQTFKLLHAIFTHPYRTVAYSAMEPISPQCYHCKKKLKKGKSAVFQMGMTEIDTDTTTCMFALCSNCSKAMECFHTLSNWDAYYLTRIHCADDEDITKIAEETEEARTAVLMLFANTLVKVLTVGDIVDHMDEPTPSLSSVLTKATTAIFYK